MVFYSNDLTYPKSKGQQTLALIPNYVTQLLDFENPALNI